MQTIQLLEKNALTDSLFHLRFSRPKHWNYQASGSLLVLVSR